MASLHEILLRINGNESDAKRALRETATEIKAFSRIHAEAEADVDTTEAKLRLEDLEQSLRDLDEFNAEPRIDVDIAQALGQVAFLKGELERMEADDVNIDVDVKQDVLRRLSGMATQTDLLHRAVQAANPDIQTFGQRILDSGLRLGPFATQVKTAIPLLLGLAGIITSVVAAIGALVASASFAVGGLAALAVAAAGALVPAIGLAVAAIARFKDQSDQAGTAANDLKKAWENFTPVLDGLQRAADPVLRAMADGLRNVGQLVERIKPAFQRFGEAAGQATERFANALASPGIQRGVEQLIRLSGSVLGPLARIAGSLARIFLRIAVAAMPLLASGLRSVARSLESLAAGTSNASELGSTIATLVGHLRSWVNLAGQLGRLFLGFVKAAAPAGKGLVDSLADGAKNLADWVNSAEGTERIQAFMRDTLPLAESLVSVLGKLAIAFLQIGQFTAPLIKPIVDSIGELLDIINFFAGALLKLPAPIRSAMGAILVAVTSPLGKVRFVLAAIIAAVNLIGPAFMAVFNLIAGVVSGAVNKITFALSRIPAIATTVAGALRGAFTSVVGTIRGAVAGAIAAATSLVTGIGGAIRGGIGAVRGAARSVIQAAVSAVRSATGAAAGAARSVMNAVRGAIASAAGAVRGAARTVINAAVSAVRSAVGAATSAGRAVVNAVRSGISGGAGAVVQALGNAVKSAVQAALGFADAAVAVGQAIVQGIASGIVSGIGSVIDAAVNAVQSAVNAAKGAAKIGSPSLVFKDIGLDMMRGVAAGIEAGISGVEAAIAKMTFRAVKAMGVFTDKVTEIAGLLGQAIVSAISPGGAELTDQEIAAQKAILNDALAAYRAEVDAINQTLVRLKKKLKNAKGNQKQKLKQQISELESRLSQLQGATGKGGLIGETLLGLAQIGGISWSDLWKKLGLPGKPPGGTVPTAPGEPGPGLSFQEWLQNAFMAGANALTPAQFPILPGTPTFNPTTADAGVASTGGTININVTPLAGGGSPDSETLAAQLTAALRSRGAWS